MRNFLLLLIIILPLKSISSEEFCEYKITSQKDEVQYTSQKYIDVNESDGHRIRVFKTETNHKNSNKNCEGLIVIKTDYYGISDYINNKRKDIG